MPIEPRFDTTGEPWEVARRARENIVRQRREAALIRAAEEAEREQQDR